MRHFFKLIADFLETGIVGLLCLAFILSTIWIGRLGVSGGMLFVVVLALLIVFVALYWLLMKITQLVAGFGRDRKDRGSK